MGDKHVYYVFKLYGERLSQSLNNPFLIRIITKAGERIYLTQKARKFCLYNTVLHLRLTLRENAFHKTEKFERLL